MSEPVPLITKAELAEHSSEGDCWVLLHHRKVYNVTAFLDEHPGGAELITEYAGQDITAIMADVISHEHSESAYEIMDDEYLVAFLATPQEEKNLVENRNRVVVELIPDRSATTSSATDTTVFHDEVPAEEVLSLQTDYSKDYRKHRFLDLNKPLLLQVLFSDFDKDTYLDQVHRPRHYGKGSAPLFGNFLEPLLLTAWWVVPTVWLPVVGYFFYLGLVANSSPFVALGWFGIGLFVWTLLEYCLHRFLFHLDKHLPDHRVAFTLHFLLHGIHHYLPMDKMRLVMPPTLFIVLCTPFYKLVFGLLPYRFACSGFAGGMFGYVCYDVTHYVLHHSRLPGYLQEVKRLHLEHHYKNYELGFGVTSPFWDKVFGTELTSTYQG